MKLFNYFCAFILTAAASVLPAEQLYADQTVAVEGENTDGEVKECQIDDTTYDALAKNAAEKTSAAYNALLKFNAAVDRDFNSSSGVCNFHKHFYSGALTSTWEVPAAATRGAVFIDEKYPKYYMTTAQTKQKITLTDAFKDGGELQKLFKSTDYEFFDYADDNDEEFYKWSFYEKFYNKPCGTEEYNQRLDKTYTVKCSDGKKEVTCGTWCQNFNKEEIDAKFKKYSDCQNALKVIKANRQPAKNAVNAAFAAVGMLDPQAQTQCECDEKGAVIKCDTTAETELEDDVNQSNCKPLNEYAAEFQICPLCKVFVTLLKACQVLATGSFDQLATPLVEVLTIAFGIYLGLQVLYLVGSPAPGRMGKFLTDVLYQGFKVAFIILLLEGPEYLFGNAISPVIEGGVDLGFSLMPADAKTILDTSIAEYGSFDENPLLSKNLMERIAGAVKGFNDEAAMIPAIGRALWCNAWEDPILKILPHPSMLIEGAFIMVFGIMIMLAVGFYLLDCVLQLGVVCCLMPLLLACWPFKITRQYTVVGWNMIVNLFFNFVMVGVVVTAALGLIKQAIAVGDTDLATLVNGNNVQELADSLDVLGLQMVMLAASCIIALKLIKEVANLANKFAPGAGISLGADLGGAVASTATVIAATAGKTAGGAIKKGGGAIAEASGIKGAAQALKGKASNGMKQLAGRFGIGSQAKMVSKGRDTGNKNSETAAGDNSEPENTQNNNSGGNNSDGGNNNTGGSDTGGKK